MIPDRLLHHEHQEVLATDQSVQSRPLQTLEQVSTFVQAFVHLSESMQIVP
jgi:hypothetical protein